MSILLAAQKAHILKLLREDQLKPSEIAEKVGVSPQVVWGIKSHWVLGKYGDRPSEKETVKVESKEALRIIRYFSGRGRHLPLNAGRPWSGEEEKQLIERFDASMSILDISQQHNRTIGAIRVRLQKLGKLPPPFRSEGGA